MKKKRKLRTSVSLGRLSCCPLISGNVVCWVAYDDVFFLFPFPPGGMGRGRKVTAFGILYGACEYHRSLIIILVVIVRFYELESISLLFYFLKHLRSVLVVSVTANTPYVTSPLPIIVSDPH